MNARLMLPVTLSKPKRRYRTHQVSRIEPAVRATVKRRTSGLTGWGTAAGVEARCSCGFHTRDSEDMAYHIGSQNTRLEAADPLGFKPLTHRLLAAIHRHGTGYRAYCTCGFATGSITELAQHIQVENWYGNGGENA